MTRNAHAAPDAPTLISLVPGAAFAIGIDIGHQHVGVIICDLAGEPVAEESSAAQVDDAPSATLDLAHELTQRALRDAGVSPRRLLGAGVGLAAPIDQSTGDVKADGILPGWHGIAPATEMHQRLGVSVQLGNDADVGALGEKVFGAGRGVNDLIYIRSSIHRHSVPSAAATVDVTARAPCERAEVLGAAALILVRSPAALAQGMRTPR